MILAVGSISANRVFAGQQQKALEFDVTLGDKPIGSHRFLITQDGPRKTVESRADFTVRFLRIPVFRYEHQNNEVWKNGCLHQLDSVTLSNGELTSVHAAADAGVMHVDQSDAKIIVPIEGCVMSFAYWYPEFLSQKRLLNPQTGELIAVDVSPLPLQGAQSEIDRPGFGYHLNAKDGEIDIKVWYDSEDGDWLALESRVEGGKLIRYRRSNVEKG